MTRCNSSKLAALNRPPSDLFETLGELGIGALTGLAADQAVGHFTGNPTHPGTSAALGAAGVGAGIILRHILSKTRRSRLPVVSRLAGKLVEE